MDDYREPPDDYQQPPDFKGWAHSWYKDGNDNNYIHCPAVHCYKPLHNNEEVQEHLNHYEISEDPDTNFEHRILQAMCKVTKCPKCSYVRTQRNMPNGEIDTDIRPLIRHEAAFHGRGELSDMGRFIGLIRDYCQVEFGGGREIWPELFEYYKRNMRKQPDFAILNVYIKIQYWGDGLTDSRLDQLAKEWQTSHFADDFPGASEEDKIKYEWCYPFKTNAFLKTLQRPNRPDRQGNAVYKRAWDIMVGAYWRGKF